MRRLAWTALLGAVAACAVPAPAALTYRVEGDAIRQPLAAEPGDAGRGREIVLGREGNCLLCHALPGMGRRAMGNLGPSLAGVGGRLTAGQLRLRIVDPARLNPETIMPSYYRVDGLSQVAAAWRGRPVLTAQQVEDTVAFLLTVH